MRGRAFGLVLALLTCHDHEPKTADLPVVSAAELGSPRADRSLASQVVSTLARPRLADPYAAWPTWCEGPATPCKKTSDCGPDRTGRARKCIRPWWSKEEKVCANSFPPRGERRAVQNSMRRIVTAQCWRRCDAEKLSRFILLVASRESSYRPWKHHRLNPDIEAAKTTWARQKATYAGKNRHFAVRERWQGWGLLGQQSATFVAFWDVEAPPEVLCRAPVAIATYLSCTRRAWTKQSSLGVVPTWETVHAACSLGHVRPRGPYEDFRGRARAAGLDPDERIRKSDLGLVVGSSPQLRNAWLAVLEADLLLPAR